MKQKFKLAICQMSVLDDKNANIEKAVEMICKAAKNGAELAVLPEMFNCPYDNSKFHIYAEKIEDGETVRRMSEIAKKLGICIAAGSIPETRDEKVYNTSLLFNEEGNIIGQHRKLHLFDIDIPDRIVFKESDVLTAGDSLTVIDTNLCRIGIAICYDIRFPELFRLMALKDVKLVIIPGAFNMVTGPAHWEPLIRVRAVDNQFYLAAASPARSLDSSYVAYGNSMVAEPWGNVISRAEEKETVIYADIDLENVERVRRELPLLKNRRTDIYQLFGHE